MPTPLPDPGVVPTHDLDPELVERTRGAQPLRRLFHAANGVLIVLALEVLRIPTPVAVSLLGAALVGLVVLDGVRLRHPRANELFFRAFSGLASPREASGMASSTWYALGVLLALALFPRPAAVSGILVLALADPAASWIGRRWGHRPFLGASVEGTAVFLLTALGVLAFRHPMGMAASAALVGTLAERLSWPLDDNLAIPVAVAGTLAAMGVLL